MRQQYTIALLSLAMLLPVACKKQEDLRQVQSAFRTPVDEVTATKAKITVEPENPDACYSFIIIDEEWGYLFFPSDNNEAADQMLKQSRDQYQIWEENGVYGTFEDMHCYKGTRQYRFGYLNPDTGHKVLVYQIDPVTYERLGEAHEVTFHTAPLHFNEELSFDIRFDGFRMTIIPSDPDVPFIWDYVSSARIREQYQDADLYSEILVDMYDQYNFVDYLTVKGTQVWDFSKDPATLTEKEEYTVVAFGFEDGEINSHVAVKTFIYTSNGLVY